MAWGSVQSQGKFGYSYSHLSLEILFPTLKLIQNCYMHLNIFFLKTSNLILNWVPLPFSHNHPMPEILSSQYILLNCLVNWEQCSSACYNQSKYVLYLIISFSLFLQHWFRGEGRWGFKVFVFDIVKVFLVVPLYLLNDYLKIMWKKSLNLKSSIFFFQEQLEKLILLRVTFPSMQLA